MSDALTTQREQALEQAAFWFASLQSDQISIKERSAWQQWLAESALNREAWAQVEQIDRQFHQLPAQDSFQALTTPVRSRRQFLYGLAGLGLALPFAWSNRDRLSKVGASGTFAQTGVGEQRQLALQDGSQLWLNTNTLVTIEARPQQQILFLRRGELYWQASKNASTVQITTDYGHIHASAASLGARLVDDSASLAITQGQADLQLLQASTPITVNTHQTVQFNQSDAVVSEGISANVKAWRKGVLVADNMRLGDFVRDLNRYHSHGWLKCSDSVANLRLVGHYSLADTRQVLDTLALSLPVTVRHITPWFTLIERNENISHS